MARESRLDRRVELGIAGLAAIAGGLLLGAHGCGSSVEKSIGSGNTSSSTAAGGGGIGGGGVGGAGTAGSGTGIDTWVAASVGAGGFPPAPCPPEPPENSVPCPTIGQRCEYGDDIRPYCRTLTTCGSDHQWSGGHGDCGLYNPALCPPDPPVPGDTCSVYAQFCVYGDGVLCSCCGCGDCKIFCDSKTWSCAPAPAPGCPPTPPLWGHPCAPEGIECTYGTCYLELASKRNCTNGVWVDEHIACP